MKCFTIHLLDTAGIGTPRDRRADGSMVCGAGALLRATLIVDAAVRLGRCSEAHVVEHDSYRLGSSVKFTALRKGSRVVHSVRA